MRTGYLFQRHKEKVLTRFKSVYLKVPLGEAKINIIMSNRSGILKSATVNVKTGAVIESKLIYNETLGNADASQKPYISDYQDGTNLETEQHL